MHKFLYESFIQFGLIDFIIFIALTYIGLFQIGFNLKSRGIFENLNYRIYYGIIAGIVYAIIITILEFDAIITSVISMAIIFILIRIIGAIGMVAFSITFLIALFIPIIFPIGFLILGIVALISIYVLAIGLGIMGVLVAISFAFVKIFNISSNEKETQNKYIIWVSLLLISIIVIIQLEQRIRDLETLLEFMLPIMGMVAGMVIAWVYEYIIAKLKYNKALNYLENDDVGNCLKYLNKSLYVLKNYDNKKNPYNNKNLSNKIISLKNELE